MKKTEDTKTPDHSPIAGCSIFIIAGVIVLFLAIFSVVVLFRQFDEIQKFTDVKPKELAVVSLEGKDKALNLLAEKTERFRTEIVDSETAEVSFSKEEINLAFAAYPAFKELRSTLSVIEITEEAVTCEISFQLNGKPRLARGDEEGIIGSDPRYLNGTLLVKPALSDGELVLEILDLKTPKAEVPEEFVQQMSPYRIAQRYLENSEIGTAMKKLTQIRLQDGAVVLISEKGADPVETITNEQVDIASSRLAKVFAIFATVFIIFVSIVLLFAFRAKKRKLAAETAE